MSFALDKPSSDKPTFIFFRKQLADGRLKYPTKEKVLPGDWDSESQRLKKTKSPINRVLEKIDLLYTELELHAKLNGRLLTIAEVSLAFDKALGRRSAQSHFYDSLNQIIDERETGKELTREGKKFSAVTIKGYRHTIDNLKRFNPNLTFEGITIDAYRSLISFFNERNDHSLNSIGKTVKNWKALMKAAYKRKLHANIIFEHEDFITPEEDTNHIHLSEAELKIIFEYPLTGTQDIVRDWFIIDCYTGLRISDLKRLSQENITGNFITIANEKTDASVTLPLHPYTKAILKKWKGLPPKVTEQEMNRSIKEVAELAGITDPVLFTITKGGKRKDEIVKKCDLISNHTARRSLITNLLEAGVTDNIVMQLAGIKKHATLMKYKKTKAQKTAEIMAKHTFFK